MDKLVIEGGSRLSGSLSISGSKNTALALMAAAVLAEGRSVFTNVPALRDIDTFSQVLGVTGCDVSYDSSSHKIELDATSVDRFDAPYEIVKKMRASFYMLGCLLGRFGQARVSLPGGCAWGPRPVDLHLRGMEALGASIELDEGYVVAKAPDGGMRGGSVRLDPSSVGATINIILAAVLARGTTRIENAAVEPDVIVFCEALEKMGGKVRGKGTRTLEIEGVRSLQPIEFRNCADRIELGTFLIAANMAGSSGVPVEMQGAEPDHLGDAFLNALSETGARIETDSDKVLLTPPDELRPVSIETAIYPGFPTDLQAQWTVMLTQAQGNSRVRDTIYTDRFKHIPELHRMGATAIVVDDEVVIQGNSRLQGAPVMSTDLRASVSLVLAGMVAEGETNVLRVYHLDRGYENLEQKLAGAGVNIRREQYDEFAAPAVDC